MEKIVGRLAELSADEEMRMIADAREKFARDQTAKLRHAEARGEARGETKGEVKGRADVARRLLRMAMSLDDIAQATGLPPADIKRMAADDPS